MIPNRGITNSPATKHSDKDTAAGQNVSRGFPRPLKSLERTLNTLAATVPGSKSQITCTEDRNAGRIHGISQLQIIARPAASIAFSATVPLQNAAVSFVAFSSELTATCGIRTAARVFGTYHSNSATTTAME